MAVNEFLQFDSQNTNSLTNEEYTNDTVRVNGISSGKARSDIMNKTLRNTSTFAAAFGEFLKSKNIDATEDMATLQANLDVLFDKYLQTSSGVGISETTRLLYALAIGDANVDKTLQKIMQGGILNALLTGFSKTSDTGDILASDTLIKALNKLQNKVKVVEGSATSNGTYQVFDVGFTPKFVIVMYYEVNSNVFSSAIYTAGGQIAIQNGSAYLASQSKIVANGFQQYASSGTIVKYVAIG